MTTGHLIAAGAVATLAASLAAADAGSYVSFAAPDAAGMALPISIVGIPQDSAPAASEGAPTAVAAPAPGGAAPSSAPGGAPMSAEKLAKEAQNPVANLISVPFQYNANFGFGIDDDVQSVLNIQPVIPFEVTPEWNLITRTILPVIYQPSVAPTISDEFGLGDTTFTAFASPSKTDGFIWGAGPAFLLPTATDDALGTGKWGAGPSFVGLVIAGPWVAGALVNNIWSFAGDSDRADVNQMTLQPFVNYNLPDGWYLTSSPIILANWEADSDDRWTIPVGGGVGKIIHVGKLPLNTSLQGYYNIESPEIGPEWQLRFQVQLLFPR